MFRLETDKRIRIGYFILLLLAGVGTAISVYLRLALPDYYRSSLFDPTIGWFGWLVSILALAPAILRYQAVAKRKTLIVVVWITLLAVFQALVLTRAITTSDLPGDFSVNFYGALEIYGKHASPYAVNGSISFPFPTYFIYWLASLGGRLSIQHSFGVFVITNTLVWLLTAVMLWRHYEIGQLEIYYRLLFVLVFLNSSAFDAVVGTGQTTALVSLLLAVMLISFGGSGLARCCLGGVALAVAALIKPQHALIGLGLFVILFVQYYRPARLRLIMTLTSAGVAMIFLVSISLWFPKGLSLDVYSEFVTRVLPSFTDPLSSRVWSSFALIRGNASPVAFFTSMLTRITSANPARLSSMVTLIGTGVFVILTLKASRSRLEMAVLPWLFASLFLTQLTWSYSNVWVLPAFLFLCTQRLDSLNAKTFLACFVAYSFLRAAPNVLIVATLFGFLLLLIRLINQRTLEEFATVPQRGLRSVLASGAP